MQSCLSLYSFWTNLLHSLMLFIVLSLCPQNLHLLFSYALFILALMWLVLITLFCASISKDSIPLFMCPFLSHIHVFLSFSSFVILMNHPCRAFTSSFFFYLFCFLVSSFPVLLDCVSCCSDQSFCISTYIFFKVFFVPSTVFYIYRYPPSFLFT